MRYLLAWFPMVLIAVANGALREAWGVPRQLSTIVLIVLLALYMAAVLRRWPLASARQALGVGALWAALTLVFEFGLGRATGLSWSQMLAEYDVTAGRLWPLVPLALAVGPYLLFKMRNMS
jgi:hypothetical protein